MVAEEHQSVTNCVLCANHERAAPTTPTFRSTAFVPSIRMHCPYRFNLPPTLGVHAADAILKHDHDAAGA